MKLLLWISFFIFPFSSFANSYVKCGKSVNMQEDKVVGYELEISSDNDAYSGPVGDSWNLRLKENGDWLAATPSVTAVTAKDSNNNINVDIIIAVGKSASGLVGTRYKLLGLYDDEPVLEKYTFGGFVGSVKTDTFKCQSAND